MLACEIVTAAAPVLESVTVWVLLEPVATFPKATLVALAANVPDGEVSEAASALGASALVKPMQPDRVNVVSSMIRRGTLANPLGCTTTEPGGAGAQLNRFGM